MTDESADIESLKASINAEKVRFYDVLKMVIEADSESRQHMGVRILEQFVDSAYKASENKIKALTTAFLKKHPD